MKKALSIIIPVLICFCVGFAASRIQSNAVDNWYPYLQKPSLTPPNWLFPIAWNLIYLFSGISIGLIINSGSPDKNYFVRLFAFQLLLNFLWSILFFYMKNPGLALVDILLLEAVIVWYAVRSYRVRIASSLLFLPYILWVGFATYLNMYILIHN